MVEGKGTTGKVTALSGAQDIIDRAGFQETERSMVPPEVLQNDREHISAAYDAITVDFMVDDLSGHRNTGSEQRYTATDLLNKMIDRSESVSANEPFAESNARTHAVPFEAQPASVSKDKIETESDSIDLSGVVLKNRFEVIRRVGRGSQAHVYLGHDLLLERPIALKVLLDEMEYASSDDAADKAETRYVSTVGSGRRNLSKAERRASFLKEAQLAARVCHPGCLGIYDFGDDQGLSYISMEYFDGHTLRALLKGGRLDVALALRLTLLISEVLQAVHHSCIVHRDIKPSNILVDRKARLKLTDFGVAACIHEEDAHHLMVGTFRYMAPEQALGQSADPRSDIFSLGAVLWEMLTGFPAFPASLEALQERISLEPPPLPPDIYAPEKTKEILARCMAPEPKDRYLSVAYLARELKHAIDSVPL